MKPARVEAEKPTLDTRPFMTGPALNATPAELLPSAVYLISYLNEAKRRPRIAHLHRSPISSFTILSTLTMAYEEYLSRIQAGWVAYRARRIRTMQLADPPPSPRPTEPVAAPSRCTVQQLAAPGQLDEEQRTGVVAAVHAAASYCVSRFYG